jgi:hypothetical protein
VATLLLTTDPDTIQQGSASTMPWDIEFAAHLAGGETVSAPTATLEDLADASSYAAGIQGVTAPSATVVRVTLQNLARGHRYRLVTRCVVSATKTPATVTLVEVPF